MYMCECMPNELGCLSKAEEGIRSPGAGVCDPSKKDAGDWPHPLEKQWALPAIWAISLAPINKFSFTTFKFVSQVF